MPEYNKMLSITSNPMDKLGNVGVLEGVAVLTLPASYDIDYTRLADLSPSSAKNGCVVNDSGQSLIYTQYDEINYTGSQERQLLSFNIDSNILVTTTATLDLYTTASDAEVTIKIKYLGIDGLVVSESETISRLDSTQRSVSIDAFYPFPQVIKEGGQEPVAAVELYLTSDKSTSITGTIRSITTAHSAARPGITSPTTIVAYEGVQSGASITVAGVSNYELIPNPELARNMETRYARTDPYGMIYTKYVLANRDRLGIRSVWPTNDYKARFPLFEELGVMKSDASITEAMAFGIHDVISWIRGLVPAASDWANRMLPGSGDVIKGINRTAGHLLYGEAASGRLIAQSASGSLIGQLGHRDALACDVDPTLMGHNAAQLICYNAALGVRSTGNRIYMIRLKTPKRNPRVTIFPALVFNTTPSGPEVSGTQLYAVIEGLYNQVPQSRFRVTGKNGRTIYGIKPGAYIPPGPNCTVVPISSITQNEITTTATPPIPRGGSMEAALALLQYIPPGVTPFAVTGNVIEGKIVPNKWADLKREGMKGTGIPLVTDQDYKTIKELAIATEMLQRIATAQHPAVIGTIASAMDYDNLPLPPPPVTDEDIMETLEDLLVAAANRDPRMAKLKDVVLWLAKIDDNNPGVLDTLHNFSRQDVEGEKMNRIVQNSLTTAVHNRGPTQEVLQHQKAVRIRESYLNQGVDLSIEWIKNNGFRGPSADQIKIIKAGLEPPPNTTTKLPTPHSDTSTPELVMRIIKNSLGIHYDNASPETQEEINERITTMVINNGNRGLNQYQAKEIVQDYGKTKKSAQMNLRYVGPIKIGYTPPSANQVVDVPPPENTRDVVIARPTQRVPANVLTRGNRTGQI